MVQGPLRRLPQQQRSRQRVERILDAAAAEFVAVGYEAATTNAIAARAGVPIGSLYQFFPNKRALLDAVAGRHLGQLGEIATRVLGTAGATATPDDVLTPVLDAVLAYYVAEPGLGPLLIGPAPDSDLGWINGQARQALAEQVRCLLVEHKDLPPERCRLAATVVVRLLVGLLAEAVAPDGTIRTEVAAEFKAALAGYLAILPHRTTAPRNLTGWVDTSGGMSKPS